MTNCRLAHTENGDLIGRGVCGEVFRTDEGNGVVKRYNSMSVDRRFLALMISRLEAMPECAGVVKVIDHEFTETPYSLLMEELNGDALSECCDLKETAAWEMIREIACALGHAHKYGVYHGHLHPGNVILASRPGGRMTVVTDFGTGLSGDVHHIDLGETAYFSAPEQLMPNGSDWEDGRVQKSDVYSFGVLAFWLINHRLPRGLKYLRQRDKEIAASGGRPVPVDTSAFLGEVYEAPDISWGMALKVPRKFKLYREIVERCLALNPAERPVDMREVRNQFLALENQFALEDAEERVIKERRKQKAKLISARALALCLGASFLFATHYLIDYLRQSKTYQNQVSELDQVVVTQQAHIDHLDHRWAETVTDLKTSREAADSFFQKMASGHSAGGSGVASMREIDLEKSRTYYLETLRDVEKGEETSMERARALHSLAHIERRQGDNESAIRHFREAIEVFLTRVDAVSGDDEAHYDLSSRLADCYETLATLLPDSVGTEALGALSRAVEFFEEAIVVRPENEEMITRLAATSFMLGQALEAHRNFNEAIGAYSRSAAIADKLREEGKGDEETLTELIGKLQYHAANALRLAGRLEDSINAHVAAMETLEQLRGVNGFTPIQSVQLASGFIELGELFESKGATDEELDQLYNESLRLLTPINTDNPSDVEVAILLCRSLGHLGKLEREEGRWSDGYRLSVRGIETLIEALGEEPSHAEGMLVLAEARLKHLHFFDQEDDSAVKIALLGVETAEGAHKVIEDGQSFSEPLLTQLRWRLSGIFERYGEVCEALGQDEAAERCFDQASIEVSSIERETEEVVR